MDSSKENIPLHLKMGCLYMKIDLYAKPLFENNLPEHLFLLRP